MVTTTSSTGKSGVDAFLKNLQKKYNDPYKIAGKKDDLFRRVATAIGEGVKTSALKRNRTSEAKALKKLEATIPDERQRKVASAKQELEFIKRAADTLKRTLREGSEKGSATTVASAYNGLSKELKAIVSAYQDARVGAGIRPDINTQDAEFAKAAADALKSLEKMKLAVKTKMISEKIVFNASANAAERALKQVKAILDVLPPAPSSVDIVV